jgi:hypothetical protein
MSWAPAYITIRSYTLRLISTLCPQNWEVVSAALTAWPRSSPISSDIRTVLTVHPGFGTGVSPRLPARRRPIVDEAIPRLLHGQEPTAACYVLLRWAGKLSDLLEAFVD